MARATCGTAAIRRRTVCRAQPMSGARSCMMHWVFCQDLHQPCAPLVGTGHPGFSHACHLARHRF
eukprot:8415257-Lingulodinium_polyedra.AAC.1